MEYLFGGSPPGMSPRPFVTPTPSPICCPPGGSRACADCCRFERSDSDDSPQQSRCPFPKQSGFFGAGAMGKTQIVRHGCKLDWIGWNNMIAFWSYGSTSITVCVYVGYISIRGTECFPHCPPHPPMIQNSLTLVWKCYSSFNSHVSSFIGPIWNKGLWQVFYRKETLL